MRGNYLLPKGLYFYSEFISSKEEDELIRFVSELDFEPIIIHDNPSKRTVKHFGCKYDDEGRIVEAPLPKELQNLRNRCATKASINSNELNSCFILNYPKGSSIGWHSDAHLWAMRNWSIP